MFFSRKNSGYTLIEILVVIGIIIILGFISISPIKSFISHISFSTTATKIKKACSFARIQALSDPNLHTGVFLDTTGMPDSVIVFVDDDKDGLYTQGTDRQLVKVFSLPESDTLRIPYNFPETIIFRGDGSAKASARFLIHGRRNQTSLITVLASTGRINLEKETH